jgi:hypothetical protein
MGATAVVNPTRPTCGLTARNGILGGGLSLCLAFAVEALAEVRDHQSSILFDAPEGEPGLHPSRTPRMNPARNGVSRADQLATCITRSAGPQRGHLRSSGAGQSATVRRNTHLSRRKIALSHAQTSSGATTASNVAPAAVRRSIAAALFRPRPPV